MGSLNTLYPLRFNNYNNRQVKYYSNIADYAEHMISTTPILNTNFIPGDGVRTQMTMNWTLEMPDYIVVTNDTGNILTRWFVVRSERTRNGQFSIMLKRDVVADYLASIKTAPCFIEKATIPNNDPMIFNSEDMTFNQIKTSETLLKDETDCAWIVGYMSSKRDVPMSATYLADQPVSSYLGNITEYQYYDILSDTIYGTPVWLNYNMKASSIPRFLGQARELYFAFNKSGPRSTLKFSGGWNEQIYGLAYRHSSTAQKIVYSENITPNNQFVADTISMFTPVIETMNIQVDAYMRAKNAVEFSNFINEHGKILSDTSTGKLYRVVVTPGSNEILYDDVQSGNLFETMKAAVISKSVPTNNGSNWPINTGNGQEDPNSTSFSITYESKKYVMTLEEILENYTVTVPSVTYNLNDAPYDMFAIPYSDELKVYKNETLEFTTSKVIAFETVMELARKYASSDTTPNIIFDLQILPYCPVRYCIKDDGTFDIGDNQVSYITQTEGGTSTKVGAIFYANSSTFTFNIPLSISVVNKKIQAMTDVYRLCSPNYSGLFEFNAAKNDGINYFNVDCTYKPFNPYIHMNPDFKNLYGQDFNDSRGLICGGDFSLPIVKEAFTSYQLQNKNYQNIFDRQIQNLELNNSVQRTKENWMVASGTVRGVAEGAVAGSLIGGPKGALLGGVIGGGTSLIAGLEDIKLNNQLRKEAIDFSKDNFGYQLGNIQALPQSISKTTAFTANNKIFPFLEFYTCTEMERQALRDKLKWNGMTVMRIGKIEDYILTEPSYIKGQIIRLEGLDADSNVTSEIASEIFQGVYI